MRILVLSKEAWRDEQNGGNVLSNLFAGMDADFAQIYCNEREPNNSVCRRYYQITDREMLNSIIKRGKAGKEINYKEAPHEKAVGAESFSSYRKWFGNLLLILREIVWWLGKWNEDAISKFIRDFNPDLIFAPCYGNHYMHNLTILAQKISGVNVISYISDDHYGNKQLRFSPSYWINHFFLRRHTRKVFKYYSLVYTMTEEQKVQCERDFGANMKVLCKTGKFDEALLKKSVNNPIRIVYAGGIYLNRWKTLTILAQEIKKINMSGKVMQLDIYTANPLTDKMRSVLDDKENSFVHPVVPISELKDIYLKSDIALHCESFDLRNRLDVRLSFSTKIVDCLDSGCAVMAICDPKQAGFAYLKRNDAAICVSSRKEIQDALIEITRNPSRLISYQKKAFELGRKNHNETVVRDMLLKDFKQYARQ